MGWDESYLILNTYSGPSCGFYNSWMVVALVMNVSISRIKYPRVESFVEMFRVNIYPKTRIAGQSETFDSNPRINFYSLPTIWSLIEALLRNRKMKRLVRVAIELRKADIHLSKWRIQVSKMYSVIASIITFNLSLMHVPENDKHILLSTTVIIRLIVVIHLKNSPQCLDIPFRTHSIPPLEPQSIYRVSLATA